MPVLAKHIWPVLSRFDLHDGGDAQRRSKGVVSQIAVDGKLSSRPCLGGQLSSLWMSAAQDVRGRDDAGKHDRQNPTHPMIEWEGAREHGDR